MAKSDADTFRHAKPGQLLLFSNGELSVIYLSAVARSAIARASAYGHAVR